MSTTPRIINTDFEYRACLAEVERLIAHDPPLGTPEGDRLESLVTLVEAYERKHFKFRTPGPAEAARFRKAEQGLK